MAPAGHKSRTLATFLLVLLAAAPLIALAQPLTLEDLLQPFEFLNVTQAYDRYSGLIDLFVYVFIFVGLAQATLARLYPGPGGRAVAVGVGLALSFSMLIAEQNLGFSLKTFGPFAATLIILVLGVMVYGLLHNAGMSRSGAAGAAYLTVFFGVHAAAPTLFQWITQTMPILGAITVLGLLASAWGVASGLWPGHNPAHPMANWSNAAARRPTPQSETRRRNLDTEAQYLKRRAKPETKQQEHEARATERNLKGIREMIRKNGGDPSQQKNIVQSLEDNLAAAQKIRANTQNLRVLNERLREFDTTLFHEDIARQYENKSPDQQAAFKKEIHDQQDKIHAEKEIGQIEEATAKNLDEFEKLIKQTAASISAGRPEEALQPLDRAIKLDDNIRKLAHQARHLEKKLLHITRRQEFTNA